MREAMWATMPRSWEMNSIEVPKSSWRRCRRSRTCAWIVTSRAVEGSSAMISVGRQAMAMAMMMRWHMPPESSWG
jgi:hypothetical protein